MRDKSRRLDQHNQSKKNVQAVLFYNHADHVNCSSRRLLYLFIIHCPYFHYSLFLKTNTPFLIIIQFHFVIFIHYSTSTPESSVCTSSIYRRSIYLVRKYLVSGRGQFFSNLRKRSYELKSAICFNFVY